MGHKFLLRGVQNSRSNNTKIHTLLQFGIRLLKDKITIYDPLLPDVQPVTNTMHYICPVCDRPLTKEKSWHYCKKIEIDTLFSGKPAELSLLFDKLFAEVASWEGVSASATKNCIVFIATKTFLVIRVMKKELDLKFVLPEECDDFPIYKKAAYGNKLEHYIRLGDAADLDTDVFKLIRQSYEMLN